MKMKSMVLLAMALGCGLVAMLGVRQVLSGDRGPAVETAKVLVAITGIMPGQPLDDTNVAFKEWPKSQIPQGAVTSPEQYVERSLRVSAVPNELIMAAKLNEKGVFGGSSEIPAGMRVATVPVTATKTHSGLILPGDRVDVVVTYSMHKMTGGQMNTQMGEIRKAKTILQYIEVFATDNIRMSAVPNGENTKEVSAKNISLLVTPDQYNLLALAETKGQISLALRHRGDSAEVHPKSYDEQMFEQDTLARGKDDKKKDDESDDEGQQKAKGVQQALEKEEAKVALASKDAKEKEEAAKRIWKLKVYEGDKLREEQVELPAPPVETGKDPSKATEKMRQFLQNFFRSASTRER